MSTLTGSLRRLLYRKCDLQKFCHPMSSMTICDASEKPLSDFTVVKRSEKSLLKLSGSDTHSFLQGIITNDVSCLSKDCTSLYTQLLTIKGRVLCDLMLYKIENLSDDLLIEVDQTQKSILQSILKKYKIRKKVKIEDVSGSSAVYSAFGCVDERPLINPDSYTLYSDPRLNQLGWRLITDSQCQLDADVRIDGDIYKHHRYRLGVGEGPSELIPEKALPLESNLVLLNGVSFNKGCYIGQELTSRSHHTGVIRKRIMPIRIHSVPDDIPEYADVKLRSTDKTVGTIRGCTVCRGPHGTNADNTVSSLGVALLRIADVLKQPTELYTTNIHGSKVNVSTHRPKWWPDGVGVI